MNILLLGEFSGFNNNLKTGLLRLGEQVTLASNGDVWKKIPGADMQLYHLDSEDSKIKKMYDRIIEPIITQNKFYGFDIVQAMHEVVFDPYINTFMVDKIRNNSDKYYVNLCGNSHSVYEAWKNGLFPYYTFDANPKKYERYVSNERMHRMARKSEIYVDKIADGLVPMAYEYAVGVRDYKNAKKTIPAPIDLEKIEYSPNKIKGKIVFYHGVTRPLDKGTPYIREAFKIIQDKYPNDVQMIIADKLPYAEYLEVLKKTNVLVDACMELGWGINPCIAMARGKVTMSCATDESIAELGLSSTPIVHITPSVKQIVAQIECILANRGNIEEWGYKSRRFIEKNHDCVKVAEQYIKTWRG